MSTVVWKYAGTLAVASALFLMPIIVVAQSSDMIDTTIRQEILKDPRASQLTPAQIDQIVVALATSARAQGMTAHDIAWQPVYDSGQNAAPSFSSSATCTLPQFMCDINTAFGFDGSDLKIPIGLGLSAMALIVIIGLMIEMHKKREPEHLTL